MTWKELLTKEEQEKIRQKIGNIPRKRADFLICHLENLFLPDIKKRIADRKYFMVQEGLSVDFLDAARDYLVYYLDHDPARGFVDTYTHLVPIGMEKCREARGLNSSSHKCPSRLNGIRQAEEIAYELDRDKYFLSLIAGHDVGEKAAEKDFMEKHLEAWATGRRIAIEMLVCPYRECCDKGKELMSQALEYVKKYNKHYSEIHPTLS